MKRGEIWTMAGGPGYASKPRPVLIVQDDAFAARNSVTVCLITSDAADLPVFLGLARSAQRYSHTERRGLRRPSAAVLAALAGGGLRGRTRAAASACSWGQAGGR